LIVRDQRYAIIATSALALGLFSNLRGPAGAAENDATGAGIVTQATSATDDASAPSSPLLTTASAATVTIVRDGIGYTYDTKSSPLLTTASAATVTIVRDGIGYTYDTKASTVGDFFAERGVQLAPGESASSQSGDAVVDGMKIVLHAGPAPLVAARSAVQRDVRERAPRLRLVAWTSRVNVRLAAKVKHRNDPRIAAGKTAIVEAGRSGLRVITYRYERRGNGKATRTMLASRIVRIPRARVIAHGVAAYASLARFAEQGFASAIHFAGSAIRMIATAYTAGCSGCSGVTASGLRAGFGVIAVDPQVIPLGTKLFIPGYGRAVAGDTGGAILGNRVDLGMNTQHDALQYGRRPITVYVLR